jgi:hypothetical protein
MTPDDLTPDDKARLDVIHHRVADGYLCADLIHEYYRDGARADRTPRAVLYFHIGMLVGILGIQKDDQL